MNSSIRSLASTLALGLALVQVVTGPAMAQATNKTTVGINTSAMDQSVRAGDDFYAFANGVWIKNTEIPADRASIGGFLIADQATEARIVSLVTKLATANSALGSDAAKIRDYYRAYLNTPAMDAAGLAPARADLDHIAAITTRVDLARVLGEQVRADVDPMNATNFETENLFGLFVTQSLKGGAVVPYLLQGGLGLPEREYYLASDAKAVALKARYGAYVAKLLFDAGLAATSAEAEAKAARILDLETKIATAHETREESEDIQQAKAEWTRAELAAKAPGLDWDVFLAGAGLGSQPMFAAYHDKAIPKLAALVGTEPVGVWKDWLTFHLINQFASVLPSKLDADRFAFFGTTLRGVSAQRPREKRAITALNGALGDVLGKLYVEAAFSASDKARIAGMADQIKAAFARRITALDWMAPSTKQEAITKVKGIIVGVGYPDTWADYSSLTIMPDNAYANARAASLAHYHQQLTKIGKPLDRGEWWMNPQEVNALNLPVQNALNFPAAILQPPFYDPHADAAFNYGAIGAVIGHEISHSFDNQGAAFDASGRLRNWWTKEDLARFTLAGKALADQFSGYEPFPGLHVNGTLTLSENIADVAGLAAALEAYHASLNGKPDVVVNGLTGDQRFFIAFAQSWSTKTRDAALRAQLATDGHAPAQYRALTVRNLDAWYAAFGVKPGDKLYLAPEKRVKVW